jgi:membrane protease YdiL (CAAX protease family)
MWIDLKTMITTRVRWIWCILILAVFFIYAAARAWLSFGEIAIHADFNPVSLITTVIFVGITEEVVFRGWLLNATLKSMKAWCAVLLNAALFALIHFPIWIYHEYGSITIVLNSLSVMAISVVFAWAFLKSKNIFMPMLLHMGWNLSLVLFFG